jgi:hypothetical protein
MNTHDILEDLTRTSTEDCIILRIHQMDVMGRSLHILTLHWLAVVVWIGLQWNVMVGCGQLSILIFHHRSCWNQRGLCQQYCAYKWGRTEDLYVQKVNRQMKRKDNENEK